MNLHGIASGVISAVNPQTSCLIYYSTGVAETLDDGTQVPGYSNPKEMSAQVQPLSYQDLEHLSGLNIQGIQRGVWLYGDVEGIIRLAGLGGDLIVFPYRLGRIPPGSVWLITQNLEPWSNDDWCHVAVTLQDEKKYRGCLTAPEPC